MKHYSDKHRGKMPDYQPGQKVMLDARNLTLLTPSRKLSIKNVGPFEIEEKIGQVNYRLKLLPNLRIHPVFYTGLLIPYREQDYLGRQNITNPQPQIIDRELEFEVDKIINIRKKRSKYEYLVHWLGYSSVDDTWETFGPALDNSADSIKEFHEKHPNIIRPPNLDSWL